MEKTSESVAQEIASLKQMLSKLSDAIDSYAESATKNVGKKEMEALGEVSQSHTKLFMAANEMLRTARGPLDMVFAHFENSAHAGALRTVMEIGVFDALPLDGNSVTATVLAEKLGADKDLLARFMRLVTIVGPFAETGPEEYAHTPFSQIYLVPEIKGLFKLMFDEFGPPNAKMYEFFKSTDFKTPNSEITNPYCFAHRTDGKSIWEYIGQYPERLSALNFGMGAQSEAAAWTVGIYPFEEKLQNFQTSETSVLLVDIGGGKGHVSKQIKTLIGDISGKIVLQERPEVLAEITDELLGVEKMEYDFFTPQPIKGALIYYIRRCLHDWSDTDSIRILTQIAGAMKPGVSRLLISEIVLPGTGADVESGWMDMTMLAVSGSERTEEHWERLLNAAGLKTTQVFRAKGTNYGALEAVLI